MIAVSVDPALLADNTSSATLMLPSVANAGASLVLVTATVKLTALFLAPPEPCAPALPSLNVMATVTLPDRLSSTLA